MWLCQACGYPASPLECTKAAAIIEAVTNLLTDSQTVKQAGHEVGKYHLALIRRDLLTIVLFDFFVVVVAGSAAVVAVA